MQTWPKADHAVRWIVAFAGMLAACGTDEGADLQRSASCAPGTCAGASAGSSGANGGAGASATAGTAASGAGASGASGSGRGNAGRGGNGAGNAAGSAGTVAGTAGMDDATSGMGGAGSDPGDMSDSGSGGTSGSGGMGGGGGSDDPEGGSGGDEPDPDPPLPDYTLTVDTPDDGASVSGNVKVTGRAPGFLNVEVWDATHQSPPLAQVAPAADGNFELTVNAATLANGATSWTVHAWDSPPGQSFEHTDSVTLALTISGGSAGDDGTPDPGTKYVPDGYDLVFNDEFTAGSLDTGKWNTLGPWGVQFFEDSHQKQAFVPEAVTLAGGVLTFTARRSNGAANANGQPYTSGSITTNRTFTHGYFEARAKVPAGKGFWPAYWLTSSTRWPPEWDIFEIIDNVIYGYPHPIQGGTCRFVEGAAGADSTYSIANLYGIYHVYGFHWTATDAYWYVDGVLTEHYAIDAAAGANDPYWLNISLQVGGDWPGDPDGSTPFPGRMEVDYMRVYQQN